jgi:ssRNA-specific RNase YbeY (16S rRNA maturation enzyme)
MLFDGEDDELFGSFNPENMTIHVALNSQTHETLCHEIFHSFLHISGYNQGMSLKQEEGLTVAFEHAMSKYLVF